MLSKKTKRKVGSALYGTFIVLYVAALAVLIFLSISQVWNYADRYEKARPDPVIEEYIAGLRENLWDESMAATVAAMNHPVQTDEEVQQQVQAMLQDEITYRLAPSTEADTLNYDLICGKNKFGRVTLVRDDSRAARGNYTLLPNISALGLSFDADLRPWKVASEEFYFDGLYTGMSITVPETYHVALNGTILGDEYITERDIPYDVLEEWYGKYPDLPTKVTYQFDEIIGHLEPVVYDENGNETVIDDTRDDWQYIEQPSQAQLDRLGNFVWGCTDAYMAFGAGVSGFMTCYKNLVPYLEPNGDLAQRLLLARDGYDNWSHTASYQFNGASLNSVLDVGGGYYILDVTAETTVIYANKGDNGVLHEFNGLTMIVYDDGSTIYATAIERY